MLEATLRLLLDAIVAGVKWFKPIDKYWQQNAISGVSNDLLNAFIKHTTAHALAMAEALAKELEKPK